MPGICREFHGIIVLGKNENLCTLSLDCNWESFRECWERVYDTGICSGEQWFGIINNFLTIL